MKKKSLLGILAILMVIALALTGCGQQGEQNAGATGSESQNGTIDEGKVTTEPEEPDATENDIDNRHPEMRGGYYVYEVLGEEFLLKTNVWDFIDDDAKTFDFGGMKNSLGLGVPRWELFFSGIAPFRRLTLLPAMYRKLMFLIYVLHRRDLH